MKISILFTLFSLFLLSCKSSETSEKEKIDNQLHYADQISLKEINGEIQIKSGGKTTVFDTEDLPLNSTMIIPASVNAFLDALDLTDKIIGVSEPDFIFNEKVKGLIQQNKVEIIGNYNEIFVEKIILNKPDIFISTSNPNLAKFHSQLEKEGIKIIYIDEYLEGNPLGKAEYLKIFGKLFGKEKQAHVLFEEIENNYSQIQKSVQINSNSSPTLLSNHIYGDIWYMPGGKSFQAILYKDAGGDYLWAKDENNGTLNLSFESVFEKANDADIWMNAGDFPSKEALLASYPNYQWFSSFKSGKVYNWNKRKSEKGANDYFEMGSVRPDWVLIDLATIFQPELFPKHELFFYQKLE